MPISNFKKNLRRDKVGSNLVCSCAGVGSTAPARRTCRASYNCDGVAEKEGLLQASPDAKVQHAYRVTPVALQAPRTGRGNAKTRLQPQLATEPRRQHVPIHLFPPRIRKRSQGTGTTSETQAATNQQKTLKRPSAQTQSDTLKKQVKN